jgi:hypothetical protein
MPNYNQPHQFYAGVDLHARSMFVHILSNKGKTVFERDLPAELVDLRYRLVGTERFLRRDVQHFSGKGNAATQSLHGNMPGPDLVRLFGAAQYAERDTAMRTIPALRERQSPDARGLETKQRQTSLVNDAGTVRFVFIQVGEAIRRFAGVRASRNQ